MTFQQLKYVIKIVETGSISAAAKELFVSQPSLSKAVMELEYELETTLFIREKTGIRLTDDGKHFLVRAKQVMDQMELLEKEFSDKPDPKLKFAIATHHYNFVVTAFTQLVKEYGGDSYEFAIREMPTSIIIDDVKTGRSELGIIYLSRSNNEVIRKRLQSEGLEYKFMFRETPHVCIGANNPLAKKDTITFADLENLPRISYEQKHDDSYFFYEELYSSCSASKEIMVGDRATLIYLLNELDGYNISTSILGEKSRSAGAVTIPLESDEYMDIGYIHMAGRPISDMGKRLLELATK
jgi:DNA-binding transcriptional LysR family regulator